jgi:threonine aldolase
MIDLRSDTVTRPTPGMRDAMVAAELGDDVYGDDPTINRLQAVVAERAGKAAGLLFPTGTQSNLAALMAHCGRGDEYLVGQQAHTYKYEGGGAAVLGSIQPQPLEHAADGSLPLDAIRGAMKAIDPHFARTRLLALENTIGGKVLPADYVRDAAALARSLGLSVHLDGARVCNAAVASNATLRQMCESFDSVSICFSKGLGAPVGSVLVGDAELIERARRWRKVLGGGMRQAGVLAAACHYALDHHFDRLAEDHDNAAWLARALSDVTQIDVLSQATNMVFIRIPDADAKALEQHLESQGILMRSTYGGPTRLVTHLDVSRQDLQTLVDAIKAYYAQ